MNQQWFDKVSQSGLGWRTSKEATYDIAMLALQRNIPGDFVECGVYSGASCALMARAIMDATTIPPYDPRHFEFTPRRVHLFDSFEGLPEPGPYDVGMVKGGARCSLEDTKKNMERWGIPDELLVYHPGWFEETLTPGALVLGSGPTQISVLRLDGDLYSSTRVCLQHLLLLVSPGGWVIVDDYDLPGCREALTGIISPAPIYFRIPEKV